MIGFYPQYTGRKVQCLDGLWDFAFTEGGEKDLASPRFSRIRYTHRLAVPGVFDTLPEFAGKRGTAFYRTQVTTTANARLLLKLGGLGMWAKLFWDRQPIGLVDLPYSGMQFEFNAGEGTAHELIIELDNRFDFARQPLLSQNYDYYCHGGIFRSIELHELASVAIDRARVITKDLKGAVQIELLLRGKSRSLEVKYSFDGGKKSTIKVPVSKGKASWEAVVPKATLWSAEQPNLHTLEVELPNGDAIVERFGLRIVKTRGTQILLNGAPLQLKGFCRHEAHPEFGPALPLQILLEDMQFLKSLGCNFVRGSHYPQDQRWLDLCDENGILVWEETVGWGDQENHLEDPHFRERQLEQQTWMVQNSFNHPSVILWGFLNEANGSAPCSRPVFEAMTAHLRELDSTRLVTFASCKAENDINFDLADVVGINQYPAWYARDPETARPLHEIAKRFDDFLAFLKKIGLGSRPVIVSEVGAGAIYGWRDRFRCHWSEEYQADYLEEFLSYLEKRKRICGVALWQFMDCRTYSTSRALGRPRAFNNKGVLDEYRRPKLAFQVVQKHFLGK
ncbi:MAG: hypothetical protein IJJ26_06405 [Victivallales bacterium]|nr:hypothetical protein [Victivallales bacterium]